MPQSLKGSAPHLPDAAAVLAWYDDHARTLPWRTAPQDRARGIAPDPYRVWLSEIMLQQTTVAAVGRYFARFTSLWPSVEALAAAPLEAVLVEWAGLGYYARARNLHACAEAVVREHQGQFPRSAAALRQLPGIGAYTSAAIAAICFDEPIAVLDGNVERVMARYLAFAKPLATGKEKLRAVLQDTVPARAGDYAQALMDLGATICTPRAAICLLCPLAPGCAGRASGEPLAFPIKLAKPERPTRYGHAFVMRDGAGDIYLRKRPDKGLLAKMTEVPTSPWGGDALAPQFPLPARWRHHGQVVHVFTHFRLELEIWSAEITDVAALSDGWWAAPGTMGREALPSLFKKVLEAAR